MGKNMSIASITILCVATCGLLIKAHVSPGIGTIIAMLIFMSGAIGFSAGFQSGWDHCVKALMACFEASKKRKENIDDSVGTE